MPPEKKDHRPPEESKKEQFLRLMPKVIQDALISVPEPEEDKSMSHTIRNLAMDPETMPKSTGKKKQLSPSENKAQQERMKAAAEAPVVLSSDNSALYVGKFFESPIWDKIQKLIYGERVAERSSEDSDDRKLKEHIYSAEMFKAALSYMFSHNNKSWFIKNKVRIVVCRNLSELFNDPADVAKSLSTEEESKLIYDIAKKEFPKDKDNLKVVDVETLPPHLDLFRVLRASVSPETGVVDIEKALGGDVKEELDGNATSLDIARMLYKATQEDEDLLEAFRDTMTEEQKKNLDKNPMSQYYALAEVAIRLTDIIRGQYIHAGVDRQAKYDTIIERMIKGKSFERITALKPLFKILEGKPFETLHLDTKNNRYALKKRRFFARVRLAITAALALTAASVIFEAGKSYERGVTDKREQEISSLLAKELGSITFGDSWGGEGMLSPKETADTLKTAATRMLTELKVRYPILSSLTDELRPMLLEFLLREVKRDSGVLSEVLGGEDNRYLFDYIDLFIRDKQIWLKNQGLNIERPYQNFDSYLQNFRDLEKSNDDIDGSSDIITPSYPGPSESPYKPGSLRRFIGLRSVGMYRDSSMFPQDTELYLVDDEQGRHHLVGSSVPHFNDQNLIHSYTVHYTSENARKAVQGYWETVKRFDAVRVKQFEKIMPELNPKNPNYFSQELEVELDPYLTGGYPRLVYKDSFGEFEYELMGYVHYDEKAHKATPVLLARKPSEKKFTTQTAREAAYS